MERKTIIPVAAIIPTMNRARILVRTLNSLFDQDYIPQAVVIVDASADDESMEGVKSLSVPAGVDVIYARAIIRGAAHQRTQAMSMTTLPFICFMDDDILLEPHCIQRVYEGFSQGNNIGGVVAMITNQKYLKPGAFTKFMFRVFDGNRPTWAGRVIGPAWNILPEDDPSLPEYVPCQWMNLGCTMYRREALPNPVFPDSFRNYSAFEDLTLSLMVGKKWELLNARTARIFHDSQPGDYKDRLIPLSEMEVVNRHYVMTKVMGKHMLAGYFQLLVFDLFKIVSLLSSGEGVRRLPRIAYGKMKGYAKILFS